MKKDEVIKFFGSKAKTARALGITRGAVSQWGDVITSKHLIFKIKVVMAAHK
jgi:DNA-binding transcriptional regulator YdaS (Cro superfamily)